MRRDMEYVRLLLIDIANGKWNQQIPYPERMVPSEDREKVEKYLYHLEMLKNAGFIEFDATKTFDGIHIFKCPKLSWLGNDFLDAVENDNVWNKTKETVKQKGLEISQISFDVIKTFATYHIKNLLGMNPIE